WPTPDVVSHTCCKAMRTQPARISTRASSSATKGASSSNCISKSLRLKSKRCADDAPKTSSELHRLMRKRRNAAPRFAVCINNESYKASLEFGKLYRVVPDEEAAEHGYLTVIDESG